MHSPATRDAFLVARHFSYFHSGFVVARWESTYKWCKGMCPSAEYGVRRTQRVVDGLSALERTAGCCINKPPKRGGVSDSVGENTLRQRESGNRIEHAAAKYIIFIIFHAKFHLIYFF